MHLFQNLVKNMTVRQTEQAANPVLYKKLHRQLTFFCTVITGTILFILTLVCLSISEKALEKNGYLSFLSDVNSMLVHLESQTVITHQWLSQMEQNQHYIIQIYDQGTPLYYQTLKRSEEENSLIEKAVQKAKENYALDILSSSSNQLLSQHQEFTIKGKDSSYYASAALLSKNSGQLSCMILYSLNRQKTEIIHQRFLFGLADGFTLFILLVFSWIFTGKIIQPLEENRKKQTSFIASASHELRSPLAVILSGLTAMEKANEPERDHFIRTISAEGKRMSHLIDDMLLLANSDAKSWRLTMSSTDADTILLDTFEKYEYIAAQKNLKLSISLPEESLPSCFCDRERIGQVLSILLDNAISYTPAGGNISLCLSFRDKHFFFSVADTGPGIPEQDKRKIFERFYRADTARTDKEHFGLGLSIAQEIVKAHNGRLWVENHTPCGSCFILCLPQS